ncbi:MAG: DEAD/DEAH box helicase family protein [Spirochaetales bacterium]|nr:DEAD/DEAH box helicase family protein [Spirochaetales bacterium]
MEILSNDTIKQNVANSDIIFTRGENIYLLGNYFNEESDSEKGTYSYTMNGNYGDYTVHVSLEKEQVEAQCSCPFPHDGCKHIVAACLDIAHKQKREQQSDLRKATGNEYLTPEEIRNLALESREERARKENLILLRGDTYKGRHIVRTEKSREYTVTIHSPAKRTGHCTCPDFTTNHLEVCKHLLFVYNQFKNEKGFLKQSAKEVFPFIHIFWNSRLQAPECYFEKIDDPELNNTIRKLFNEKMIYTRDSINQLYKLYHGSDDIGLLQFDGYLLQRMEDVLYQKEISKLKRKFNPDYSFLNAELYPYQKEGVRFAVFKKDAIIADEMGLGKTLQAITVAEIKKHIFGFSKVLVITPASVKDQWKREIEKFSNETSIVVSGGKKNRQQIYKEDTSFFKITNYEAVLRDILAIVRWSPDFIILDEAQRIKNFETKTHQSLLSIPRSHSLVITGTPLENKLVDVYGIVQFSDHTLLTPLWAFAANHFNMSKSSNNKVLGYRNLEVVHNKLKNLIIRRRKEEVFDSLPDEIVNTYYLDLTIEQEEIHQGYLASMFAIISKKVLTPMDIKRLQKILLSMRMVCDSTYLIDKKTNISPKLAELANILRELVIENGRKVVLFSEWTTMTYLIGKVLSDMGIDFVEFTGRIPTKKRQKLIDEFDSNPDCKVFLATDAGGIGLNLQSADCVINFELPWNPARLNQRIGRVNRIGQKSSKINVVNLVTKNSIEEKVFAAINLKQELFDAVLSGGVDEIDFSQENKAKFVNQIRAMFDEEPIEPSVKTEPPELDEKTPHFLNPNILSESENTIDVAAEEFSGDETIIDASVPAGESASESVAESAVASTVEPEQLESVLNQGMDFLNALSQMATGKAIVGSDTKKAIEIDRETGEVVLRFKMPGF